MSKFIILGEKKLSGEIAVAGAKNAVLPLLAACLLTSETCVLSNVPQIRDVEVMVDILERLGVSVIKNNDRLEITAANIDPHKVDFELLKKLRASILIAGPLLGRCSFASVVFPGGDKIGSRPIDAHLEAFKLLGAGVNISGEMIEISTTKLLGTKIVLEETSVTATENAMMAAVLSDGVTVIKLAAMEPHVQQLGEFLNLMGAEIDGLGSPTIVIKGVKKLHGAEIEVIPDSEEASSLITMAAATSGDVVVKNINPNFLEDFLLRIKKMRVNFEVGENFVYVMPKTQDYLGTKIQCGFYPKLNSDYLPPMSVLATQSVGETMMYEWLYEDRLGHIAELVKMGANATILDPHRVKIIGPTKLTGTNVTSYDLRMGMTLVIAGLVAGGTTEIDGIEHIDRGYARIEERLRGLGAEIRRV
jgi:UDP-N-acetylglucosamine 1-carboxyvinyltransferase